jgi:hypothetical protein
VVKTEDDLSVQAAAPADSPPIADAPSTSPTEELRALRIEVAVLEERLAAAREIVAERDQRIRDLRGALRLMSTALSARTDQGDGMRYG